MKTSAREEQNIKTIYSIFFILALFILTNLWIGCSSSAEAIDDDYLTETTNSDSTNVETPVVKEKIREPVNKSVQTNQQFSVQADTLVVLSKRKHKNTIQSSISVKSSAPKKFYTVEVGAFRLASNVRRHQEQLAKRFNLPVTVFLDSTIHLTRVCVGNFSSKKTASDFLKTMKEKHPKDYPDPWVSQLTK